MFVGRIFTILVLSRSRKNTLMWRFRNNFKWFDLKGVNQLPRNKICVRRVDFYKENWNLSADDQFLKYAHFLNSMHLTFLLWQQRQKDVPTQKSTLGLHVQSDCSCLSLKLADFWECSRWFRSSQSSFTKSAILASRSVDQWIMKGYVWNAGRVELIIERSN